LGEPLRLAGQTAKGARMEDSGGIAGKGSAIGVGRLKVCAAGQRFLVRADGDCGRELAGGRSFNIHHIHPVGCRSWAWDWASRETDEPANLVIPQAGPGSGREVSPSELPLNLGLCRNCRCVRPGEKDWTTVF